MKDFFENYYPSKVLELCDDYIQIQKQQGLCVELGLIQEKFKDNLAILSMLENIEFQIKNAYIKGAVDGVENAMEIQNSTTKLSEYAISRNFMFALKFGDNDFGGHYESAAKVFCDRYKNLLSQITVYGDIKSEDSAYDYSSRYKEMLNQLEQVPMVCRIIKQGVFSSLIEHYLTDEYYLSCEEKDCDSAVTEAKRIIKYLGLDNIEEEDYFIGTVEEVEKQVLDNWYLEEEKSESIDKMWLNGEVLFIKVKDGKVKYWLQ